MLLKQGFRYNMSIREHYMRLNGFLRNFLIYDELFTHHKDNIHFVPVKWYYYTRRAHTRNEANISELISKNSHCNYLDIGYEHSVVPSVVIVITKIQDVNSNDAIYMSFISFSYQHMSTIMPVRISCTTM